MGRDQEYYAELAERMFCGPGARYGPFTLRGAPEIVAPGLIVRIPVHREGDESEQYELSIFDGIEGFAGELWEHEVRSLLRLEALDHPALPKILTGGYDDQEKIAFTITDNVGAVVQADDAIRWAQENKVQAFEQFSVLLDALSQLHGARILHRNLTASALRAETSQGATSFRLARFELSTLIGNMLRQATGKRDDQARELIRQLYLVPPEGMELARHLAYLAPETHAFLFDAAVGTRSGWETTDIFGMGMLGWEWFCGLLPDVLPAEYAAVAAEGLAAAAGRPTGQLTVVLATLHKAMRAHLTRQTDLPRPLATILGSMLEERPTGRDTSFQLCRQIEVSWEAIRGVWEPDTGTGHYLLAFMPAEAIETVYEKRQWITRSPEEPAGRDELRMFFQRELRQAELVRSSTGAVGYATGPDEDLRAAEWVLIGERAVWFCAFYYQKDPFGRRSGVFDEVLVVKYLKDRQYAQELATAQPRRRVGKLDLIPFRAGQDLSAQRGGRPSWRLLTDSLARGRRQDPKNLEFLQSLEFLLDYQRVDLEARQYPYVRVDDGETPGTATIKVDTSRDDAWRHRSPMRAAYAVKFRRPFGDFFGEGEGDEDVIRLEFQEGVRPSPFFGSRVVTGTTMQKLDQDTITVTPDRGARIPAAGWVRRLADGGSRAQLDRQERGRTLLEGQPGLIRSLRDPLSIDLGRIRRASSSTELEGDAPQRIRAMLGYHPFYALQGPPGSGKTTVAAHALGQFLESEAGARVLISAQSNFALDNLAARLIDELPRDNLVLRITSENAETPPRSPVDQHTLEKLTSRVIADSRKHILRYQRQASLSLREQALATAWLESMNSDQVEMGDRIKAGASVVLATCSMAASVMDGGRDVADMFDWVIVEEAAKAWPTEIVVPLVLGARWTLIGDHRQLGAHRSEQVEEFLDSLAGTRDEDLQRHYQERHKRLNTLALFRNLFEGTDQAPRPAGYVRPVDRLTWQFRMHRAIAQPVARTFYPCDPPELDDDLLPVSFLQTYHTANRPHEVVHPGCLADRPLVWIDTSGQPGFEDKRYWSNQGEVKLIATLVEQMDPPPAPPDADDKVDGSLAVLTPYRAQVKLLTDMGALRGRVHTVHSFQGREADRVIVSLVRSERRGQTAMANVGHVGTEEVANVLLSRARRLCILVGSYQHFAENGGPAWQLITQVVQRYGKIVPVGDGVRP